MHRNAMHRSHFTDDPIQRQLALHRQPIPQPGGIGGQLALGMVALNLRQEPPAFALQDHHVIDEARRNPKVPRRLSMPMTFFNKGDHSTAYFHRMWLTHSNPQSLVRSENHKAFNLGILNRNRRDLLVL